VKDRNGEPERGEWMGADKKSSPGTRLKTQSHFQRPLHKLAKIT
jgi:hypothetical protein